VLTVSKLEALSQQLSQKLLVLEFICAKPKQRDDLLVRQNYLGRTLFLFSFFLCHL